MGNGIQHPAYGQLLVIASLKRSTLVFKRHLRKTVPPGIGLGKGRFPQILRRRKARQFALPTRLHINTVNTLTIAGIGEANTQLTRVIFSLADTFCQRLIPGLSLNYR